LQLRSKLPEEDQLRLSLAQKEANDESQHRPKSIVSSLRANSNGFFAADSGDGGGRSRSRGEDESQSQGSGNWEELQKAEEKRREQLLADLIRYRWECFLDQKCFACFPERIKNVLSFPEK
jgi:hypothetical protein